MSSKIAALKLITASILGWSAVCSGLEQVSDPPETILGLNRIWRDDPTAPDGGGWSFADVEDEFYRGFWLVDELHYGPHLEREFVLPLVPSAPGASDASYGSETVFGDGDDAAAQALDGMEAAGTGDTGDTGDAGYAWDGEHALSLRINFTYTLGCSFNTHDSLLWYAFAINNERLAFDEFDSFDLDQNGQLSGYDIKGSFPYVDELCIRANDSELGFVLNDDGVEHEDVWVNLTYSRAFVVSKEELVMSRRKNGDMDENEDYYSEGAKDVLKIVFGSETILESRAVWAIHSVSIEVGEVVEKSNGTVVLVGTFEKEDDDFFSFAPGSDPATFDISKFVKNAMEHSWWTAALLIAGLTAISVFVVAALYKVVRMWCLLRMQKEGGGGTTKMEGVGVEGISDRSTPTGLHGLSGLPGLSGLSTVGILPRIRRQRRKSVFDGIDASVIAPDRDHNGPPLGLQDMNSNNFINSIIMSSDEVRGAWRRDMPEFEDGFDSDADDGGNSVSPGVTYRSPVQPIHEHQRESSQGSEKKGKKGKKKGQKSRFPMFKPSKQQGSKNKNENKKSEDGAGGGTDIKQGRRHRRSRSSDDGALKDFNTAVEVNVLGTKERDSCSDPDVENAEGMVYLDQDEPSEKVIHRKTPSDLDNLMASLDVLESKSRAGISRQSSPRSFASPWKNFFSSVSGRKSKSKSKTNKSGGHSRGRAGFGTSSMSNSLSGTTPSEGVSAGATGSSGSNGTNGTYDSSPRTGTRLQFTPTTASEAMFDIPDNASELSDIDYQGLFMQDIAAQNDLHALNKLNKLSEMENETDDDTSSQLTALEEASEDQNDSNSNSAQEQKKSVSISVATLRSGSLKDDESSSPDTEGSDAQDSQDSQNSQGVGAQEEDAPRESGLFSWFGSGGGDRAARRRARRDRVLRKGHKGGDSTESVASVSSVGSVGSAGSIGGSADTAARRSKSRRMRRDRAKKLALTARGSGKNGGTVDPAVTLSGEVKCTGIVVKSRGGGLARLEQGYESHNLSDEDADVVYGNGASGNESEASKSKSTSEDCIDTSVSENERGATDMMMEHVLLADDMIADRSSGSEKGVAARDSCGGGGGSRITSEEDDSESFDIAKSDNVNVSKKEALSSGGSFKFALQESGAMGIATTEDDDDDDGSDNDTTIVLSTYTDYKADKDKPIKQKLPMMPALSEL